MLIYSKVYNKMKLALYCFLFSGIVGGPKEEVSLRSKFVDSVILSMCLYAFVCCGRGRCWVRISLIVAMEKDRHFLTTRKEKQIFRSWEEYNLISFISQGISTYH